MAYLALYRQYRPRTFEEVLGQDIITRTLKNQIISGRFAHAYLFCGSRGTGKTSTAKILARAINCLSPVEGNPCGQCEICQMPDSAIGSDIIEIDAASNNGVDEIRELRDKIRYGPAITKYKVYIIDEVHMLSMGAFNALLKTLEEPPEHAVFILATTELHKLPATIVSRCQRFDFQQLNEKTILSHMQGILADLNRTADIEALACIANAAEGGMRDALSILDQCLMITDHLTLDDVYGAIGYVGGQSVDALFKAMDNKDVSGMLSVIDAVSQSGANLSVFVRECMQAIRNRLIQSKGDRRAHYSYAMEVLASLEGLMRYATRPRVLLDAAAVRLCMPQSEGSYAALMARVEALEKKLSQLESQPFKKDDLSIETPNHSPEPMQPIESKAATQPKDMDAPPWAEDAGAPPWDEEPVVPSGKPTVKAAPPPKQKPLTKKQAAQQTVSDSKKADDAPVQDTKSEFLSRMGKADAGVSQSIRLCRMIARIQDTVYIAFARGDEIFVNALRQYLDDLTRIGQEVYGEDVRVMVVTEDQIPKAPMDQGAVVQKAQEIFGVPIEIEET